MKYNVKCVPLFFWLLPVNGNAKPNKTWWKMEILSTQQLHVPNYLCHYTTELSKIRIKWKLQAQGVQRTS